MKTIVTAILFLIPATTLAAGGYVGPTWLSHLFTLFFLPFPLTFLYLGYLSFCVARLGTFRFLWLYLINLVIATLAVSLSLYLTTHENTAWLENLCMLLVFSVPIYTAFLSYQIDKATENKHSRILRLLWYTVFASVGVLALMPVVLMLLQTAVPSLHFYL